MEEEAGVFEDDDVVEALGEDCVKSEVENEAEFGRKINDPRLPSQKDVEVHLSDESHPL